MESEIFYTIVPFFICFLALEDVVHVLSLSKVDIGNTNVRHLSIKALKSSRATMDFIKVCMHRFKGLFYIKILAEKYKTDPVFPMDDLAFTPTFSGQVLEIHNSSIGAVEILNLVKICNNLTCLHLINSIGIVDRVMNTIIRSCPSLEICVVCKNFLLRDLNLSDCPALKRLILKQCPRLMKITGAVVSEALDLSFTGLSSEAIAVSM